MTDPALARERLDPNFAIVQPGSDLLWYDAITLGIRGQGWPRTELAKPYDRLPAKAESTVRPQVWALSRHCAGLEIGFVSDASEISASWTVSNPSLAMDHMPATGVSGVDLYVRHEGRWRWLGMGRPRQSPTNQVQLVGKLPAVGMREYRLYLPLYNGLESLQLGVSKGATIAPAPVVATRPVVLYGTSIAQGGCASRPGMAYPAILGRALDVPMINLGFSGNAHAEPEVARLVAELDAAVFILDPLTNFTTGRVQEQIAPFFEIIRAKHPRTPVVLLENIDYQHSFLMPAQSRPGTIMNHELKGFAEPLMARDRLVFQVSGATLLGDDGEGTVDGSHPNDLGMLRYAQAIRPVLAQALACPGTRP